MSLKGVALPVAPAASQLYLAYKKGGTTVRTSLLNLLIQSRAGTGNKFHA